MDTLFFPKVEGYQIFSFVTKGWRIPFDLLGDILIHILDDLSHHLHFSFERMIELFHKLIHLLRAILCWLYLSHSRLLNFLHAKVMLALFLIEMFHGVTQSRAGHEGRMFI